MVLLSGFLMALPVSTIVAKALSNECKNRGICIALNLAARSQNPILAMDFLQMKDLISELIATDAEISYAFILDNSGQTLAHTFTNGFPVELKTANRIPENQDYSIRLLNTGKDFIYDFATPSFIGNDRVGTVRVGLSKTKIDQTTDKLLWMIAFITGLSILIAGLAGAGFANHVTKRIERLYHASEDALRGNLRIHAAPLLKKNCWEIMNCNRKECPAFGDIYRRCWYVAGTMCANCTNGGYTNKIESCKSCPIYLKNSGDEIQRLAESFDAMALSLRNYITQLEDKSETLRRSERKYRRIFEGSMEMIFVIDNHGNFIDINPAGISMLGYMSIGEIQGINFNDFLVKPDRIEKLFEKINSNGFVEDWDCTLRTKNGRELQVLVSSTPHIDNGNTGGYEGIIKNITQRKNMEQQLLKADKLASLGQLAAGVAHEINNPLGLILGYTQLLIRNESVESQKKEDLNTIEKHTRNCKMIVEDLLKFARRTETKKSKIDINQTIEEVIAVIQHQFNLDNIRIKKVFHDHIPPIKGDNEKLKQVFMNLLLNARQAIPDFGTITVTTTFAPEQGKVCIIVNDTGCGIPKKNLNKIFDPFFSTKPTGQGTGLGLSVSYGIIKEHNGEISVTSEPEIGTTFKVELPVCYPKNEGIFY
jgi:two-component system, NtrC family, sensor kinase